MKLRNLTLANAVFIAACLFLGCSDDDETGCLTCDNDRSNERPVAQFTYTRPTYIGSEIRFDASSSHDNDGSIASWTWTFDGNAAQSGKIQTRSYSQAGNKTVTLTVTDNNGATSSASATIEVVLSGTDRDCASNNGNYSLTGQKWAKVSGFANATMIFGSSYQSSDPSWRSVSDNAALRAMGEWHWNSDAAINCYYQTGVQSGLYARQDNKNTICVARIDGAGGTAAHTQWWYRNDQLIEADIVVDISETWGTNGEANRLDLQSVLTHEFGHLWGLGHPSGPSSNWETMDATTGIGETFGRSLYCGDKRGVQALYGRFLRTSPGPSTDESGLTAPPQPTVLVTGLQ